MEARDFSRREFLWLCGICAACGILENGLNASENLIPASKALDHLVVGISDLDQGITLIEGMTGVKAAIGGSHPGIGTRNALISLGSRQYLEIIAPDPAQKTYNFPMDLRAFTKPQLILWGAATNDIDGIAQKARESGHQIMGPREGSRTRPDGKVLQWKTLFVMNELGQPGIEPVPFFIEWSTDSIHPSQDSPKGCELLSFQIDYPDPTKLVGTMKNLGIELKANQAKSIRLVATLGTPKGKVELS